MNARCPLAFSLIAVSLASLACSSDEDPPAAAADDTALRASVVANYAHIVEHSYERCIDETKKMQVAIKTFVDAPSEANLAVARTAWIEARKVYGQTEAFRFYGGPIDADDTGPEGRINGWPLDEAYVDYVADDAGAGLVNHPTELPEITPEALGKLNEKGGEKNLSTGWHAIEFLLWGQDMDPAGPGARPFTDFVSGPTGTATNQDRRRAYLTAVTDLLVEDLESVEVRWHDDNPASYSKTFVAQPAAKSLGDMLKGMASLSGAELSRERMNNAYETKDQEEEHSCFSDQTAQVDLLGNALSLQNVYLGRFGDLDGPGLDELLRAKNPILDDRIKAQLEAALTAIKAIPAPFDQAIVGADDSPGRTAVRTAIDALKALTTSLVEASTTLSVTLNLDEE